MKTRLYTGEQKYKTVLKIALLIKKQILSKKGLGISRNSFLHKNIQSIEMAYTNDTLI